MKDSNTYQNKIVLLIQNVCTNYGFFSNESNFSTWVESQNGARQA